MRYIYTILFYLAIPFILLRFLWRSRKNPDYRARLKERFGFIPLINNKKSLWLHAVSLGELIAATPLITQLLNQYPDHTLVVTTTTPTGSREVKKRFGDKVYHVYTPFDLPTVLARFLKRTHPQKVVIMETELWPNLLHTLHRAKIPTLIANARLSQRSFTQYKRLRNFFKPLLQKITMVATQSNDDQKRFQQLGASQTTITGNIKFDIDIPADLITQAQALKTTWQHRPNFIAASTHEGEEGIILNAFKQILAEFPQALLLLVPRHPERFDKVAKLCLDQGFSLARRSQQALPDEKTQIYLGDTMGELKLLYGASEIAFVGGSFVPIGGHNLIEPASLSLPVLSGPHLENFIAIRDLLQEANGLVIVNDDKSLASEIMKLFRDKESSNLLGARALSICDQNRGAIEKHLDLIKQCL